MIEDDFKAAEKRASTGHARPPDLGSEGGRINQEEMEQRLGDLADARA